MEMQIIILTHLHVYNNQLNNQLEISKSAIKKKILHNIKIFNFNFNLKLKLDTEEVKSYII